MRTAVLHLACLSLLVLTPAVWAQTIPFAPERLTTADYERAERQLSWNIEPLVHNAPSAVTWLEDGRLWYRNPVEGGHEFVLVDPVAGTRERAFDHERMAAVLSEEVGRELSPLALPLTALLPMQDGRGLGFELDRRRWQCDLIDYVCPRPATIGERVQGGVLSPDGRHMAFIRSHNLWVQNEETGEQTQLTTDGQPFYGYATDSEGWRRSDRPALTWSPDGRHIFTHRLDEREVGEMVLWRTVEGRPELYSYRYALPGDEVVPLYERVIIDVERRSIVPIDVPPDHQRTSSCCGMLRGDALGDVEWRADGGAVAFASTSRDYNTVSLRLADPSTGSVREVFQETVEPYFESNHAGRGVPNWRVLHGRGQFVWHSARSGNHHLYLYDLNTGAQIRALTSGNWNVIDVMHLDEAGGRIFFTGANREDGRDPYFRHLYSVRLDGGEVQLLTPEDADHVVAFSGDGAYFVDSFSNVGAPPRTVVRRADGSMVMQVQEADISRLLAAGWSEPLPFTVKARDGATDIYGLMYRPSNFDPNRRYALINHIYPGPQVGSVGPRTFRASRSGQAQALAELGFIVVQIDALGTPMRGLDLHAYYYADLGDNGLEDQIAGMRQLAERHDWIDLDRVGIYGHSGGGYAAARAMLAHPDFFHVGVAGAGNHDNRGYTYYWGEKWHGPLVHHEDGTDSYTNQANHLLAENLQGRLLLSYGTMDSNVHPAMTLLLVDALIAADKDFDLMVLPNRGHGYGNESWWIRQTWNYFVQHLLGAQPDNDFRIRR